MTTPINKTFITSSTEIVLSKIQLGQWNDVFNNLCNIKGESLYLDYIYFKYFATKDTYEMIIKYVLNNIDSILSNYSGFIVHINMKNLTIKEIDIHMNFIKNVSALMKDRYPNKLTKCYVHNAPFVFKQMLNIVSLFIDKETQSKIEVVTI